MPEFQQDNQQTNNSANNLHSWREYLSSKISDIKEATLQVYLGSIKVDDQVVNRMTLSHLWDDDIGQGVQQALENRTELNVSARILLNGEKVGHIKAGEVLDGPPNFVQAAEQVAKEGFTVQQVFETVSQIGQSQESIHAVSSETVSQDQPRQELPQTKEFIPPSWNDIRSLIAQQQQRPEVVEDALFQMMVYQTTRINQLEQKLEAMSQVKPLNTKTNKWLESLQQTAKGAVKKVSGRVDQIPQDIGKFLGNIAFEIQAHVKEMLNDTRAEIASIASDIKSSSKRMLADIAGNTLNAGTRFLAERFGEDNGAGIKVFKGEHLLIAVSANHSAIYSKEGKELVKDGQFVSAVTSEQLSRIAQVPVEAQRLAQAETQVKAKALRA